MMKRACVAFEAWADTCSSFILAIWHNVNAHGTGEFGQIYGGDACTWSVIGLRAAIIAQTGGPGGKRKIIIGKRQSLCPAASLSARRDAL